MGVGLRAGIKPVLLVPNIHPHLPRSFHNLVGCLARMEVS